MPTVISRRKDRVSKMPKVKTKDAEPIKKAKVVEPDLFAEVNPCSWDDCKHFKRARYWKDGASEVSPPCLVCCHFIRFDFLTVEG